MIDWSFILSAISSIVLAVTLIILIIQTWIFYKQAKAALDASCAQSLAQMRETELKINEVFLQKPELRQYFYGGVHLEENSPLYADAESAAELFLDIMEHVLWQARFFPQLFTPEKSEEGTQDTWKNYFHDMFISSPLLRKYLEKRRRWYSPLVIEIMKQASVMTSHGYKPDSYSHFTNGDEKQSERLQGANIRREAERSHTDDHKRRYDV